MADARASSYRILGESKFGRTLPMLLLFVAGLSSSNTTEDYVIFSLLLSLQALSLILHTPTIWNRNIQLEALPSLLFLPLAMLLPHSLSWKAMSITFASANLFFILSLADGCISLKSDEFEIKRGLRRLTLRFGDILDFQSSEHRLLTLSWLYPRGSSAFVIRLRNETKLPGFPFSGLFSRKIYVRIPDRETAQFVQEFRDALRNA